MKKIIKASARASGVPVSELRANMQANIEEAYKENKNLFFLFWKICLTEN